MTNSGAFCACSILVLSLGSSGSVTESLLLSRLADSCGSVAEATATWAELIALAGLNAGKAGSFNFEKLPQHLRERHKGVTNASHDALQRLRDHTEVVVRSVGVELRAGETSVTLPRTALETQLLALVEAYRVVLVAGEAGAGKSALAKMGFQLLGNDTLALAFRAEEFARAHLDDVFAPFGVNFFELKKATAGFTRKVLWIESIERLL